ncbi:MAG: hypothetical protein IKO02_00990, partial [Lentisphaeria bacterium]|nr:hypothetical protein [Lentisphaeria bacterium]
MEMKKTCIAAGAILLTTAAFAQFGGFGGFGGPARSALPEGFVPAETNIYNSEFPAVNPKTKQAFFRMQAPGA